jgi:hypothetical protein
MVPWLAKQLTQGVAFIVMDYLDTSLEGFGHDMVVHKLLDRFNPFALMAPPPNTNPWLIEAVEVRINT